MPFTLTMAAALLSAAAQAVTTSPADVYAKAAPSVWRVQTYDSDGLPITLGSAVVIDTDMLVTNCHVLSKAKRVVVKRDKTSIDAKLMLWDPQRDVCQINAPLLGAPAVSMGDSERLQVGQNVYAIGNPKGLDLTVSTGLLSSIRRNEKGQIFLLQTSAAISGGSSGGGLFDGQGALIGLTTIGSVTGDAQNLNFAIPVEWIKELPSRHARLNKPEPAASAVAAAATPASAARASVALEDATRLPYQSDKMRERYMAFLTRPLPRAFVISESGRWYEAWGTKNSKAEVSTDPRERALRECEKRNGNHCFVYAVDNRVVYEESTQ